MKRKQNNEKTALAKKQTKEGKKKKESLPPDVRTLWAKATSSQAPFPVTRPDDYEPGDSDFEEPSLSRARSTKSSNPRESKPPDKSDKSDFRRLGILESPLASLM